jgi:AraC-like DNA-binding protein
LTISLVEIALLFAASQGFFLAIVIFHRSRYLFANRFLGLVIFLYSFVMLEMFLNDVGFYLSMPYIRLLTVGVFFALPPLHFLYARYLTHSFSKLQKGDLLHFVPFVLVTLCFAILFFSKYGDQHLLMQKLQHGHDMLFVTMLNWAILIQIFPYLVLTLWILHSFEKEIKSIFSDVDKIRLHWLRNITLVIFAGASIFLIENIIYLLGYSLSNSFNLSSGVLAASVYIMGYSALFKSAVFLKDEVSTPISKIAELSTPTLSQARANSGSKKYAKSGMSPETAQRYLEKLENLIQTQKPYLVSDLTLPQLANMLDISPHNLSEILNTHRQTNFFDFINHYRMEVVKKKLSDPKTQHLNILAIAFDAGFNSKTSFNTFFKNHTGQTPSQYRHNAQQ